MALRTEFVKGSKGVRKMKTNFMMIKKAIPAALMLAGAMGLSTNASASAYAISYDNIFGLAVTTTDANGGGGPFYVPLSAFTDFSTTSSATGLQGPGGAGFPDPAGLPNSDSGGGPVDAQVAYGLGSVFPGGIPVNNAMTAQGQAGNYSYADAQVSSTALSQPLPGQPVTATGNLTQAWNIAEGFVSDDGNASASGINSSETGFTTQFELGAPAIFNFDFMADPYMMVAMGLDALGGTANANLDVTFTITGAGGTVFEWSPNGEVGGITGGTENLDPFNLNGSIEVTAPGDSAVFDPNGNGAPTGDINPASFGTFSASTFVLAAGTYTLSLDMIENINIRTAAAAVPQPGILALFGLSLAGLGLSRRRKAS
ncbi:MAG: hypothetical protein ACI9JM_000066 [Halioglobus sp.]